MTSQMETGKGLLFVLVGPGGAGKNALLNAAKATFASITQLATATTRPMREDEAQGREHLFVDKDEFERMIADDELLEHQEVTPGRYYGIPRASVEDKIYHGEHLIADIEVNGAKILRRTYPDHTILIFVTVPGETIEEKWDVLRQRMTHRLDGNVSDNDKQRIQQRLDRARTLELPFAQHCDYVIVNDDRDQAIAELESIIRQALATNANTPTPQTTTSLQTVHQAHGATLADDGIPLHYGDLTREYTAALDTAVLLDRSHEGRIELHGDSRFDLLNRMSTNKIEAMAEGEGRPTIFTNANARILYRVMVYNRPDHLLLITQPGQNATMMQFLQRNIFFNDDARLVDITAGTQQLALHGTAASVIMHTLDASTADVAASGSTSLTIADTDVTVLRRKPLVEQHWTLVVPIEKAVPVYEAILQAGDTHGLTPAGSLTYNTLRIRAGLPAGRELSSDYLPLEVGLWDEVHFAKGCYTGQEIIARMESRARLAKTIVALDLEAFVAAPATVMHDGKTIGTLTSSVKAPTGEIFALAVIKTGFIDAGTPLTIGDEGVAATVQKLVGAQPDFITQG